MASGEQLPPGVVLPTKQNHLSIGWSVKEIHFNMKLDDVGGLVKVIEDCCRPIVDVLASIREQLKP